MARYLLDSDAVIDYLRGMHGSVELLRDLHERGDALCVCDVTIAEVYSGLRPEDRDRGQALLDACLFLVASPQAARQAGEWRYAYARQGLTLSTTDLLVAGTAYAHGAAVVTGNADDYPMREVAIVPLPRARR